MITIKEIMALEGIGTKVIKLYAFAMLHYRQPKGDKAWEAMRCLIGSEITDALAFLCGFSLGSPTAEKYKMLLEEPRERLLDWVLGLNNKF